MPTHKTCRRISFACDYEETGLSHIEIQWNKKTVFFDITDDKIIIGGPVLVVKQNSVNTVELVSKYPN